MIFNNLILSNFKNFEKLDVIFDDKINCLVGKNGVGKTNILDALHYLSMTKSAVNSLDSSNIRFGEPAFVIKSEVENNDLLFQVTCAAERGKKKLIMVNRKEHEKLSDHIGLFPVVIISPNDVNLIHEGNEIRRKFFDSAISQQDNVYLHHLVRYMRAVKQRNALLKKFSETMQIEQDLLAPYDHEILTLGKLIHERRSVFMKDFTPHFNESYRSLSCNRETVGIEYESIWQSADPEKTYKDAIKKDLIYQRTTVGIHRDSFHFEIGKHSLKRHGSQGQQKSFLIALKLAQFNEWVEHKQGKPVLLLDDIFDKLDDDRMHEILNMVAKQTFGQLFITDARPERTLNILKENNLAARIIEIENNEIIQSSNYVPVEK